MAKNLSDREVSQCRHMSYSFQLAAWDHIYTLSHRQVNTYHGLCYTSCEALTGIVVGIMMIIINSSSSCSSCFWQW